MTAASSAEAPPLVLVASADDALRSHARRALEALGCAVADACGVAQGASVLDRLRPRLALFDLRGGGPVEDALSALPRDGLPLLALVEARDAAGLDAAWRAGAVDVLLAPVDWARVAPRLRFVLRTAERLERHALLAEGQRIAGLGSWELELESGLMQWSEQTFDLLGLDSRRDEASLARLLDRVHPADRPTLSERVEAATRQLRSFRIAHRLRLPDGRVRRVLQRGEPVCGDRRRGRWMSGTIQTLDERRAWPEAMRPAARFDGLTGLVRAGAFADRVDRALEHARSGAHPLAVLCVDLDGFERLNQMLGCPAGDQLLQIAADVLRREIRASDLVARIDEDADDRDGAVSRLDGDGFAALLARIQTPGDAAEAARRLLAALAQPLWVAGRQVSMTGCVGIAAFPADGSDAATLLRRARVALVQAKREGRNTYRFFCTSLSAAARHRPTLESRLHGALERDELRLLYQPRVDLRSGRVSGVEALLRWDHPELGPVLPKEFIPLAEENGLIGPMGSWVLERACAQGLAWQQSGLGRLRVSVNISTRQFAHVDLVQATTRALRASRLAPADLELELTESLMLQDDEEIALALRDLRAIGVRIALDDFGTGYSALSYLARLPLDTIKMDRRFVRDVAADPGAAAVASAVIAMAHGLGVRVVAEGVDHAEQARFLREQGCDEVQGFLLSEPLPADEVPALLRSPLLAQRPEQRSDP